VSLLLQGFDIHGHIQELRRHETGGGPG
jgi:hypothetical protein